VEDHLLPAEYAGPTPFTPAPGNGYVSLDTLGRGKTTSANGFKKGGIIMALDIAPLRRTGGIRPFWREMEDLWDRVVGEMPLAERSWEWMPSVDISETDGKVQVRAELPGMEAKDIDVDVSGDVLTLRGEKSTEEEQKDERYYCRERRYGSFQRSFNLPTGVQSDQVDAQFKNGVLTVNMPKSEESEKKKIEIKES
jgi:HSP20 family protein